MSCSKMLLFAGEEDDEHLWNEEELLEQVKGLYRRSGPDPSEEDAEGQLDAKKLEVISKLREVRVEEFARKQVHQRMAWRQNVRKEMERHAEFKEEMESVPLEDVEKEEKPTMSRMSLKWRDAFKKDRTGFLFPEVVSAVLESPFNELSVRETFAYRPLCKSVKDSIDKFICSKDIPLKFYRHPFFRSDIVSYFCDPPTFMSRFHANSLPRCKLLERVTAFANKFTPEGQDNSPFFCRHIWVKVTTESLPPFVNYADAEDWKEKRLFKELELILRRWGRGVWSAIFEVINGLTNEAIHLALVTYLKLMPNLRVLKLFVQDSHVPISNPTELSRLIKRNPLPELPSLRHLETREYLARPTTLALLSKYGQRLDTLYLDCHRERVAREGAGDVLQTASTSFPLIALEGNFASLEELGLNYYRVGAPAEMVKIFKDVHNWAWRFTLKRVFMEVQGEAGLTLELDNDDLDGLFWGLPQLETIELQMFRVDLKTLDFLLPCKALKIIGLCYNCYETTPGNKVLPSHPKGDEIFQLAVDRSNEERVYQSRIWKLLPLLKKIVLATALHKNVDGSSRPQPKFDFEVYTKDRGRRYMEPGQEPFK